MLASPIVLGNLRDAASEFDPRLFRGGINVNVGYDVAPVVERAEPYEAQIVVGVVTPQRHFAAGTTGQFLPATTGRRGGDELRLTRELLDLGVFDESIESEGRAGLSLAPAAVTAMDEER